MKINELNLVAIFFIIISLLFYGCKKDDTEENPQFITLEDQELPYRYPDWMSNIDGSLYLTEITIPGTHDSGADRHTSGTHAFWYDILCQDFAIPNQLELGVRWLDIRLAYITDEDNNFLDLNVHHSIFDLNKDFGYVLDKCTDFLKAHPRETIVVMIKQEYTSYSDKDFGQKVYDNLTSTGLEHFYLKDKIPTLDEVRGKIVIVRRFLDLPGHDLGMYIYWPDNTEGYYHDNNGVEWWVQDHYSFGTNYDHKIELVKEFVQRAINSGSDSKYTLNYVSGEDVPSHTLYTTALHTNVSIDRYFIDLSDSYTNCGVVLINFAGGGDVDSGPRNCVPWFVYHILQQGGI